MATYSMATNRPGINTANSPMIEWRVPATLRMRLLEVGISVQTAPSTAPRFAIARATNSPAGGTASAGLADDAADPAALVSCLVPTWSTAPTFTTAGPWLRALGLPVTVGGSFIWTFPNPIVVAISSSLLLVNLNASGATLGAFDIYAVWDE